MQWAMKSITTSTWGEVNLNSASATSIAQPQTSVQSCLICSQLNRDQIWPFFKTTPTAATSSTQCPVSQPLVSHMSTGRRVSYTLSMHPKNKSTFVPLFDVGKRKEERVLVKVAQGANRSWLSKLSKQPRYLQPPLPSLRFDPIFIHCHALYP